MTVASCGEEKHPLLPGTLDPERFPTMRTTDVSTLISDSGIVRYKITAPLWLMFEEARRPQWRFPKGLHLEKYDNFFRRDATVDCDSATFFKEEQLWRLDGYVRIANIANEKFLTRQLFWDQRHHKIYSDSFIHIEKSDRIIEGYGFESDERMTNYRVRNVSGIFPIEDFKAGEQDNDTVVRVHQRPGTPMRRSARADSTRTMRATPVLNNTGMKVARSVKSTVMPATRRKPSRPGVPKSTPPTKRPRP